MWSELIMPKPLALGAGLLALTTIAVFSASALAGSLPLDPKADPGAVVISGQARFTLLTPSMMRLEWSPESDFEDRASFAFINRRMPVPDYSTRHEEGWLVIETDELVLRYREGSGAFDAENLTIRLKSETTPVTWHAGMKDTGNLGGTVRTLDQVSGATPLEPGLVSRDGWVLVDDSQTLLFDDGTPPWATVREGVEAVDWYFLGYGHDYTRALKDYTLVTGSIPLPPHWSFGAWWSRYWAYTDEELKDLVRQYREHDVPLDVLVIDMDWHLEGWTGYTWNREYFPDPKGFLDWCHDQGLHVTLNLHPHDGVRSHEAAFPAFAKAMGLNPDSVDHIPFDIADPRYMDVYFRYLHHPLERQGIDFWWIDWQQGEASKIPGLDPLFWLNHLHWSDMERNPERKGLRPMILSRWGGPGTHRYQIGFSGDAHSVWASLAFQPYFTATAGNICYPYWSHDIGGHIYGPVEDELYARWIQFAALNPLLRTHSTKNPKAERRIWAFPPEIFATAREAFHLRYKLVPYIYMTARQTHDEALPLLRPLYYEWPELDEAYANPGEYLFGDRMLVAPVAEPRDRDSRCAVTEVWLPPGRWHHWFSGRVYAGPGKVTLMSPLSEIPLFVRAGAIIPMMPKSERIGDKPPVSIEFHVFPGDSGTLKFYEDDGISTGYEKGEFSIIQLESKRDGNSVRVTIGAVEGSFKGMRKKRDCRIILHDIWPVSSVLAGNNPLPELKAAGDKDGKGWWYDAGNFSVVVQLPGRRLKTATEINFELSPEDESSLRNGLRGRFSLLEELARSHGEPGREVTAGLQELREEIARNSTGESATTGNLPDGVDAKLASLTESLIEADAEPAKIRERVFRLFRLTKKLTVTWSGEDRFTATTAIRLLEPAEGISARITYDCPANMAVTREAEKKFLTVTASDPLNLNAAFRSDSVLQTTIIRSELTLRTPIGAIEMPIEQILLPSINSWWILGPFDNPFEIQLETIFPPELKIDFDGEYTGKGGKRIGWKKAVRELEPDTNLHEEFFLDFNELFGKTMNAVAYALTYIDSPEELDAILAIGSDDGVVIWLNDEEIHRYSVGRPYTPKEDHVELHLRKGRNKLLVKIGQGRGGWGFCAHLEDGDGNPLIVVSAGLRP